MTKSPVSIKLSEAERAEFAELASATKRSVHFHMRAALSRYLEEQAWRRSFIQEAEEAWQHYKETGLHVTMEEMEQWAKDISQELPKCHT